MSQWNNSYAYNNQYQGWNEDLNTQYGNQAYYAERPAPGNQYVSFNEFLTQMQGNGAPSGANYSNVQYENYPQNQYTYPNVASSSQNSQSDSYNYPPRSSNMPNGAGTYNTDEQNYRNTALPEPNLYGNELILKSNLTPTAMEFVPKTSGHSSHDVPEPAPAQNELHEPKAGSSSGTNWRERPRTSQQRNGTDVKNESNHRSNESRNQDSSNRNRESYRHNDTRYHESNSQRETYRNTETSNRQQDSNNRHEPNRNHDSNNRAYENKRGQNRVNPKSKNKDPDARTFYNSSISKDSQDVRNGRGEGSGRNKHWAGSQRLRTQERNNTEDEQYAHDYVRHKDERVDRVTRAEHTSSPARFKSKHNNDHANTEMTQRERLTDQLDKGTLECLVCCERVKQTDSVWSCGNCYHVFHLRCIRKWAMSSTVEGKWRCPACQNTNEDIPTEYRCMCGAIRSPDYQRGAAVAHTCGKACKRARACVHPCTLLCHPGPCPPCQATVTKQCGCGAETRSVLCSSKLPQICNRVCGKTLECGAHKCQKDCHEGPCDSCTEIVTQVCHCPAAKSRSVACTVESGSSSHWSCSGSCGRVLACGAHVCRAPCHPPPCCACPLLPTAVRACPCGKTRLDENSRKSCTDPIPLCGNICAKPLTCGPTGDKHFCKIDCHEGPCPTCPDKTVLQCRCGHSSREVPCAELPEMYNNVFCQKKCNKKLSCGRHRCRTVCCAAESHRCAVVCGRTLSCQTHRCEEFCHTGHCAPCPRVSFEELTCECGAEVILPPVRCGTRPPACTAPCRRERPCGHLPHHSCHSGDCPPCVVLTAKRCHGDHEERKTIPCSQEEFSCGLPCGKPLPCGKHTCIKTCHKGPCDTSKCVQPCTEKRPSCGHECAAPCHVGAGGGEAPTSTATPTPCPSSAPCRKPVRASCPCGRRHADRTCADNARDYAKMMSALAATKMQEGGSVDLSEVQRPGNVLKTLECDDECRVEARTRQLALALQIRNPDVSAKLAPRYSEHVRATAAREPSFAQLVHDRLTELVQLAKKSKQKTRAHSFPSMNWQKRQFIHELCEHFGCESVAYDAEPNRNVVATADREKSWLPAMSVLEVLAREAGKRKVPGPVLRPATNARLPSAVNSSQPNAKSGTGWATLTSTNAWAARSQPRPAPVTEPKIDYFDNPPDN